MIHDGDKDVEVVMQPDGTDIPEADEQQLVVYPNPAHTSVTAHAEEGITLVRLVDIQGQVVYEANASGSHSYEINVSNLRSGIYLMQVTTADDTMTTRVQVTR